MPSHLSESEMDALIGAARERRAARPARTARSSSCSTRPGCGSRELAGLDLDDVNLSARMVRVLGKGGKERIVPFNESTAKAIRAYLSGARSCRGGWAGRPGGQEGRSKGRTRRSSPLF
jgi:integrase/recombinase XerC